VVLTPPGRLQECCTRYDTHRSALSLTNNPVGVKVGLLSKDNVEQVPFAYKLYKTTGSSNDILARGFKKTFCRIVPIDFVGVWWVTILTLPWSRTVQVLSLSLRNVFVNSKKLILLVVDDQGHSCKRGCNNRPIFTFCGREYNDSGVQTSVVPR
jgi:hypothetical protein